MIARSVSYSVHCMHKRKDYWGPDGMFKFKFQIRCVPSLISVSSAEVFDPDRFLDSRLHTYLTPNPFIFLPFNAGPRICLGQQFAYNEASFMLVRLLQAFDRIELAPDAQPKESFPPEEWKEAKEDRQSWEKVWPKSHLTAFVNVSV